MYLCKKQTEKQSPSISKMAEILEMGEELSEGVEDLEAEDLEALPEEDAAEISSEVESLREDASVLSNITEEIEIQAYPTFGQVLDATFKIAIILQVSMQAYTFFKKLFQQGDKDAKMKCTAIKALLSVLKSEKDLNQKLLNWLKEHKDDKIVLAGEEIPLTSLLSTHVTPISATADEANKIAKTLKKKIDGKTRYNSLTGGDLAKFLDAGDAFHKAFSDLIDFTAKEALKFKELSSFAVKKPDVDDLASKLKDAKALPLW